MAERPLEGRTANPTVVDVARLAGVSAMTVSRALNTPDIVAAATVERVRSAAKTLGYVKNRMAGGLRSNKSHLVAAIVPTLAGPMFLESIDALNAELARAGYHLVVAQAGYADSREDELLGDIISRRPDAIVLTGTIHSFEGRRLLRSVGIPVVEMWDLSDDPIDLLIGFSHEKVGAAVAQYLVDRGSRRPAWIGADDARSQRRYDAYARRARALGTAAAASELVAAPATLGDGRSGLRALLEKHPEIDAVFCSSDMVAAGALVEARALGIPVPGRLRIVGFGDLNFAADLDPALSTVRINAERIGRQAAQVLLRRFAGETVSERLFDLGFTLVERQSG